MHEGAQLFPFYYPTTVMFVDDNQRFLKSLGLQLDENLVYKLVDSPIKALELIRSTNKKLPLYEQIFSRNYDSRDVSLANHGIRLDVGEIYSKLFDASRYGELSVVVVDYDMPDMNGLDFCRELEGLGVKKILLTGVADEKVAVKAFNEGLIDCFVLKSEADVFESLNGSIKRLQTQYFKDSSSIIVKALGITTGRYFNDKKFVDDFLGLCRKHSIVEYYLISEPEGFLLIDVDGGHQVLMVLTEQDLRLHIEMARNEGAPSSLLERLISRNEVPYFPMSKGYYQVGYPDWDECFHPATRIDGDEKYYRAFVKNSPFEGRLSQNMLSYAEYLEACDCVT